MSDFDREAERERLREKYERDQEKRQSTQRMSELLLRGATMTDSHCDDCGDPIFRYDGQEFCATCQAEGVPAETDEATDERVAGPPAEPAPEDAGAQTPADAAENGQTPGASAPEPAERATPAVGPGPSEPAREQEAAVRDRASAPATGDGDIQTARDSLARTVARFARRAEETDSPREATDHLAAAREAAEALAALDRR